MNIIISWIIGWLLIAGGIFSITFGVQRETKEYWQNPKLNWMYGVTIDGEKHQYTFDHVNKVLEKELSKKSINIKFHSEIPDLITLPENFNGFIKNEGEAPVALSNGKILLPSEKYKTE